MKYSGLNKTIHSNRIRKTKLFKLAVIVSMLAITPAANAVVTKDYNDGVPYEAGALSTFGTFGADMVGMSVTAYFAAGGSEAVTWAGFAATGSGWSLSVSGNTFCSDWTLSSTDALSGLSIYAAPGDTIFDVINGTIGTADSANGWAFTSDSSVDITATYSDIVALTGETPVGDLYASLDLSFSSGITSLTFRADTDNSVLIITPEPATVLLFGLGGLVLRRRK